MKAVRIHQFGGPEVLNLEEAPLPEPGEGEVRIRVLAASVNPVDYKIRGGGYPRVKADQLPMTLGRDVAGAIDKVGPGVGDLSVGEEVYAMLPSDRGGYAEFVAVKASDCARWNSFRSSGSVSDFSTYTCARDSKAELTSKDGFSVVAPMNVTRPLSA